MRDAALLLFALLLLGGVILLLLYLRYRHSPAVLWRGRVLRRRSDLLARRAGLLSPTAPAAVARLADDLFARHLRTVPVSELAKQPGIGPATVEKLKAAGWESVADVRHGRLESLPGLGAARGAELIAAVRRVTAEAKSRFDAGACPEGVEFRRRVEELTAAEQGKQAERARQAAAIDDAVAQLDRLHAIARDVSFWNSLFHQTVPGLTDAVLHAELPDVPVFAGGLGLRSGVNDLPTSPLEGEVADTAGGGGRAVTGRTAPPPGSRSARTDLPLKGGGQTPPPSPPVPLPPSEPASVARLRLLCRFGVLVAKADGRVAKAEKAVLREYLGRQFASDTVALRFIDPVLEQTEPVAVNEADVIATVQGFPLEERRELLELAGRIASATGQASAKEQQLLARLHAALDEVPPPPPAPEPAADPRAVLEIPPGADLTPELIRRRYHFLSDKSDPGKAAGLGEEFVRMAERKRAELKAAAEALLAPLGVPLDPPPAPPPPSDLRHNPDLDAAFGV